MPIQVSSARKNVSPVRIFKFPMWPVVGVSEERVCAAEDLVFVAAGAVHGFDDLISDASRRQGGERSAARLPDVDRAPQTDPGLLSEILRVTASRQPLAGTDGPDQRLVSADEFCVGVRVATLGGEQQDPFVVGGPWASKLRDHARVR